MAAKNDKSGVKLMGPLYLDETKSNLGGQKVAGPTGGKSVPDPLNLNKAGGKKK